MARSGPTDQDWSGQWPNGVPLTPGWKITDDVLVAPWNYHGVGTAGGVASDQLWYCAFPIFKQCYVDTMQVRITTADATQDCIVGVYGNDYDTGRPTVLLTESSATAITPVGALDITVTGITLAPGWYWAAYVEDAGTAQIARAHTSDRNWTRGIHPDRVGSTAFGYSETHVFAALPVTVGTLQQEGSTIGIEVPLIGLKRTG